MPRYMKIFRKFHRDGSIEPIEVEIIEIELSEYTLGLIKLRIKKGDWKIPTFKNLKNSMEMLAWIGEFSPDKDSADLCPLAFTEEGNLAISVGEEQLQNCSMPSILKFLLDAIETMDRFPEHSQGNWSQNSPDFRLEIRVNGGRKDV
ncbi:MAG: hypothetical protein KKB03_03875 [Nanoarchaeota archaeon]|nr:hypothetical protein [Nanoarchaeota archaeon]MBU2520353.1 hypothetical protein [Nanoarchaeota archaeon]